MKIRVFLAEPLPVTRVGMRCLLENQGLIICGEACGFENCLAKLAPARPNVVVGDFPPPAQIESNLLRKVRKLVPHARVLIFSAHDDPGLVERAFAAGAHGYLCKQEAEPMLVTALQTLHLHGYFLSPDMRRRLADRLVSQPLLLTPRRLSDRETEIFQLLGTGFRPTEIAEKMSLSPKTIHTYLHRLKEKLNLRTTRELQRQAISSADSWKDSRHP